jgi:hypothetical protein
MNSVVIAMVLFVGVGLITVAMVTLIEAAIPNVGPPTLRAQPWSWSSWWKR